jgi:hypothetical protein
MKIVWFQDEFGPPVDEIVLRQFRALDWRAGDGWVLVEACLRNRPNQSLQQTGGRSVVTEFTPPRPPGC